MAFEVINPNSSSPFLITAEHSGNEWPREKGIPDFPENWQNDHIAYDRGAGPLVRALAESLGCAALLGKYTRLLVDLNRARDADDLIVPESDGFLLKSNQHLNADEISTRIASFYEPYHKALSSLLDKKGSNVIMVSLHTFTPQLRTKPKPRPWQIGILYNKPSRLTSYMLTHLKGKKELCVGDNKPYNLLNKPVGAVILHAQSRGLDYVEIEIRNNEFDNLTAGVQKWCSCLTEIMQNYLAEVRD